MANHPELTAKLLATWFEANEQQRLARRLVYDAFAGGVFTASRFIALAQAWEIAGRELEATSGLDSAKYKCACEAAGKIFEEEFGSKQVSERVMGLLQSSNKASFRDILIETMSGMDNLSISEICGDVPRFASIVVKTRNALAHMQGGKKFALEYAYRLSLPLSFKLAVLFAIREAQRIGMPMANLDSVLANNEEARAARQPLPPSSSIRRRR